MGVKMIRLLIIDDHPIVISGLQNALGEQGDIKIVGHVLNAKDALEWANHFQRSTLVIEKINFLRFCSSDVLASVGGCSL